MIIIGLFMLLLTCILLGGFVGVILGLIHFIVTYPEKRREQRMLQVKFDDEVRKINIKHH